MDARTDGDAHDPTDLLEHYRRRVYRDGPRGRRGKPASTPPTVRVTDGIGGNLLLAGDGLESGSISVDGANAKVVAQAPGDNAPSSLDIHAEQLAVDSMDVSVVMGTDQRSVDRHVSLRVWANFGVEDALVLRQPGEPITADEQTPFGAFETRTSESGSEHQVVETYTEADGTTTVQVQRNPSSRPGELPDRNLGHRPAVHDTLDDATDVTPTNHDRSTSR